mmetsp:Transcript_19344/g.74196  ORF Transcript_19344/g.74196 Transcript_19344/m.74196 type:complete len:463 (-) Transcript_19344:1913-3301(-)
MVVFRRRRRRGAAPRRGRPGAGLAAPRQAPVGSVPGAARCGVVRLCAGGGRRGRVCSQADPPHPSLLPLGRRGDRETALLSRRRGGPHIPPCRVQGEAPHKRPAGVCPRVRSASHGLRRGGQGAQPARAPPAPPRAVGRLRRGVRSPPLHPLLQPVCSFVRLGGQRDAPPQSRGRPRQPPGARLSAHVPRPLRAPLAPRHAGSRIPPAVAPVPYLAGLHRHAPPSQALPAARPAAAKPAAAPSPLAPGRPHGGRAPGARAPAASRRPPACPAPAAALLLRPGQATDQVGRRTGVACARRQVAPASVHGVAAGRRRWHRGRRPRAPAEARLLVAGPRPRRARVGPGLSLPAAVPGAPVALRGHGGWSGRTAAPRGFRQAQPRRRGSAGGGVASRATEPAPPLGKAAGRSVHGRPRRRNVARLGQRQRGLRRLRRPLQRHLVALRGGVPRARILRSDDGAGPGR